MLVAVEIARLGNIADKEVRPSVVVEVTPNSTQPKSSLRIAYTGFLRYFFERSIAAVVKQKVCLARHAPWRFDHQASVVRLDFAEILRVGMDVTRNEEVNITIAIVIAPGCAGAEAAARHASLVRHIFELAVTKIVIQRVTAIPG